MDLDTKDSGYCKSTRMYFVTSARRDLVPITAALEHNQWFAKLSSKDLRLVSNGRHGPWCSAGLHFRNVLIIQKIDLIFYPTGELHTCFYFFERYFPKK